MTRIALWTAFVAETILVCCSRQHADSQLKLRHIDAERCKAVSAAGAPRDFREQRVTTSRPADIRPVFAQAGHIDADGLLDLAIGSSRSSSLDVAAPLEISVLLGNDQGTFEAPSGPFVVGLGTSFIATDVNSDGQSDIVNDFKVALSRVNGTLADPIELFAPRIRSQRAWGDIDGDGTTDFVDVSPDFVTVRLGSTRGVYGDEIQSPVGIDRTWQVRLAQVDGGGAPDLLVSAYDNPLEQSAAGVKSVRLGLFLGQPDGQFGVPEWLDVPGGFTSFTSGDFNCDGQEDLVLTTGGTLLYVYLRRSDEWASALALSIEDIEKHPLNSGMTAVVGDVNGDGAEDIVASTHIGVSDGTLSVLLGNGLGDFLPPQILEPVVTVMHPTALAVADLNEDGAADM